MADSIHDLRYSLRALSNSPGFTVIAVATLALAIGANTATFSVLDAVVLEGLPYRDAERLGVIWVDFGEEGQSLPASSSLDFRDYKEMATLFEDFAAGTGTTANLNGSGGFDPEQVDLGQVTYNFFSLLGVTPSLGRAFREEEDVLNGPRVAILSDAIWRRRFGADPFILGRIVQLNGAPHEVVGVMPPSFALHFPAESWLTDAAVWVPLQDAYEGPRNRTLVTAISRLRDGVSFEQAQEEMDRVARKLREEHLVHEQSDMRIRVVPLHQDVVKNVKPALVALFGAVGLVLAVACGTVANLMLARATAREREIAIRLSLGASRARVVRQLLTESALVAFASGTLGLLLALWGTDFLLALQPTHLPRVENIAIGREAFGFTLAACLVTVVLFGVLPALRASRPKLSPSLRAGGPTGAERGSEALRAVFVVGEVALALVLLIGVGLLMRSYLLLGQVRPGFDPEALVTFRLSLPTNRYPSQEERIQFHDALRARLETLPGVRSAGAISFVPLGGGTSQAPYAYDADTERNWESVTTDTRTVTESFFETAGTKLVAGRLFVETDTTGTPLVVVVDDTLARKAWPGGPEVAVGRRLMLPFFGPAGIERRWAEVIGVIEHLRLHDLSSTPREQVFFPARQRVNRSMDIVLRTERDPEAVLSSARTAVREIDPELPFHRPRAMTAYLSEAMALQRFTLVLGACFGGVALLLAVIALYGLISYNVSLRARELGIRIALGARAGGIFGLVVGRALRLVVTGIAVGIPGAILASRALGSLRFGVDIFDASTFVGVALLLAVVAFIACYVPARRATRIDPTLALRCE